MKKIFLPLTLPFLLLSASSNDYMPLSKISKESKEKYNLIVKQKQKQIIKTVKIKKAEKSKKIEKQKKHSVLQKRVLENKTQYEKDILISTKLEVAALKTKFSNKTISLDDSSALVKPEIIIKDNNHNINTSYFFVKNRLNNQNIKTKWLKLGYFYSFDFMNLGFHINKLHITNSLSNKIFPSIKLDFTNSLNKLDFKYGASYGYLNNLDNYSYFVSILYKLNNNLNFALSYENQKVKYKDEEFKYYGPSLSLIANF